MNFFKNPTTLIGFILFLALVFSTIYRITIAVYTNPGLVNDDTYSVNKNYATDLNKEQQLKEKGYKLILTTNKCIAINKKHNYQINWLKQGNLIKDATITAYFYRQLEQSFDFNIRLLFANKYYSNLTALTRKGKWLLVIKAQKDDVIMYKQLKINVADNC